MLLWFLMLGALGCTHIGDYSGIWRAFNPWYAVRLLIDYPGWFLILGAVFLCTTGAEALYSDLGHCGRLNISVSWLFVKAMLILNYLGQGAWIVAAGPQVAASGVNPFYAIMPSWFTPLGVGYVDRGCHYCQPGVVERLVHDFFRGYKTLISGPG